MVFRVCTTAPTAEEEVGTTYGIAATSSGEAAAAAAAAEDGEIPATAAAALASSLDADGRPKAPLTRDEKRAKHRAAAALQSDSSGLCDGGVCRAWARTPFCSCIEDKMENLGWMMAQKRLGAGGAVPPPEGADIPVVDPAMIAKLEAGTKGPVRDIGECASRLPLHFMRIMLTI